MGRKKELVEKQDRKRTMNRNITVLVIVAVTLAGFFCCRSAQSGEDDNKNIVRVPYKDLVTILDKAKGYKRLVTTNTVRYQSEAILNLIKWAERKHPRAVGVFLGYDDWYRANLEVNDVEEGEAPVYMKLAYQNKQDMRIVFRGEGILKPGNAASRPDAAAIVTAWWPKTPGCAKSFRFIDRNSVPVIKVTNKRVINYRIMWFEDMIICDKIEGISGRPLTGLLGLLFKFIGDGRVVESRTILSKDDLQIVRAYCKKGPAGIWALSTIYPDGRAIKDIPKNRPDLQKIVSRLNEKPKVRF